MTKLDAITDMLMKHLRTYYSDREFIKYGNSSVLDNSFVLYTYIIKDTSGINTYYVRNSPLSEDDIFVFLPSRIRKKKLLLAELNLLGVICVKTGLQVYE